MDFDLDLATAVLERTPRLLNTWLDHIPDEWTLANEGGDSWSPFDVVGHLIHGERTDWIPRAEIILSPEESKEFKSFDRFAQFEKSRGKSLKQLLNTFMDLRTENLRRLRGFHLTPPDLDKTGIHPDLGRVTLKQLLSTWVAHDLNHLAQIAEVMARQYTREVGPWKVYLDILGE